MKAFSKLCLVREVKAVARPNVIDVPTVSSIVLPGHAGLELDFEPRSKEDSFASTQVAYSCNFGFSSMADDEIYSTTTLFEKPVKRIDAQSSISSFSVLFGSFLCISPILFVRTFTFVLSL